MHSCSVSVPTSPADSTYGGKRSSQRADRAYEGLTIIAVLLLLASLWLW